MIDHRRPFIGDQVFLELEREGDGKSVFIDPTLVCLVEPDEECDNISCIRLYSLGGHIRVIGTPEETALMIQQARQLVTEVGLETLIDIVREEVADAEAKKSQLN